MSGSNFRVELQDEYFDFSSNKNKKTEFLVAIEQEPTWTSNSKNNLFDGDSIKDYTKQIASVDKQINQHKFEFDFPSIHHC